MKPAGDLVAFARKCCQRNVSTSNVATFSGLTAASVATSPCKNSAERVAGMFCGHRPITSIRQTQ